MEIIVYGGHDFDDYGTFCRSMESIPFFAEPPADADIVIVSDNEKGTGSMGRRYAYEKKFKYSSFSAERERYGNDADFFRNMVMVDHADGIIVFWDGKPGRVKYLIDISKLKNLWVVVFGYYGNVIDNFVPVAKHKR